MSRVASVSHPVPVRYVPRRGRHERAAFDLVGTPVPLREADPSEFRHAGRIGVPVDGVGSPLFAPREILEREGRLWTALRGDGRQPLPVADLLGFMAGGYEAWRRTDLVRAFQSTPLLLPNWTVSGERDRKVAFARSAAGEITHDGTDRARADLAAFLDDNLLLCRDAAYVRVPGLLAGRSQRHSQAVYQALALPRGATGLTDLCRADALLGHWAGCVSRADVRAHLAGLEPVLAGVEGFEGHVPEDDDILQAANLAPVHALAAADNLGCDHPIGVSGLRAALSAERSALIAYEATAALGSLRRDEVPEVLRLAKVLLDAALSACADRPARGANLRGMSTYISEELLPRLPGGVLGEDLDAMAGLGA